MGENGLKGGRERENEKIEREREEVQVRREGKCEKSRWKERHTRLGKRGSGKVRIGKQREKEREKMANSEMTFSDPGKKKHK